VRLSPTAIVAPLVVLLLTWLSFRTINPDAERYDRALVAIDQFITIEGALQRDVLAQRGGMLRKSDDLDQKMSVLNDTLDRLSTIEASDLHVVAALGRLAAATRRQEAMVALFKANNAILQNSLEYFGQLSARLGSSGGTVAPAVSSLASAMLQLAFDSSPEVAQMVDARLEDLARQPASSVDAGQVQAVLAHGQKLREILPATDHVVAELLDSSITQEQQSVRSLILTGHIASRAKARRFRVLLYVMSLLLFGFLHYVGVRLRRRTFTLRRRAAIEHVIARISTRFLNIQSADLNAHVQQALAQLAGCLDADRAYFVVSSTPLQLHAWSRAGQTFSAGWPDRAPRILTRFHPTSDGIIYVPDVDRLPFGREKEVLVGAGIRGWACVTRTSGGDVVGLLGFDKLQSGFSSEPGDLGLLRMALDAIANAVGREILERERARLEKRQQQARRMETIGTLTSGVAHNFNNIVGAILGYTEMAEAHIVPGTRLASNIGEIRRSGERARDLVEQILTFGRRRDVRPMAVQVEALVAEAKSLVRASLPPRIELIVGETPERATIFGEPGQLQQVILNLCNNAAQAIDETGYITLETSVQEVAQPQQLVHGELVPGRYLRLSISDVGRGMDEAIVGRIFEPFFTTRPAGNGLGLATVREIVLEHGGAIDVCSKPGMGSRFDVWLPTFAAAEMTPAEGPPTLPLGHGETVLVIDDDRDRLHRSEEILAAIGYEPIGFTHVADAIEAYRTASARFDILVIGYLNSATAIEITAKFNRLASTLPIILSTGSADEISVDKLAAAGVYEVVRAPLNSTEIAIALASCLGEGASGAHDRAAVKRLVSE